MKKAIAVDFDGVIHAYRKGYHDGSIYDNPMPGSREALRELGEQFKIVVFTCRKDLREITYWMLHYDIPFDEVTNTKPLAVAYIDDRGIRFVSWQQTLQAVRIWEM